MYPPALSYRTLIFHPLCYPYQQGNTTSYRAVLAQIAHGWVPVFSSYKLSYETGDTQTVRDNRRASESGSLLVSGTKHHCNAIRMRLS
jgi:hypothetical protein